MDLFTFKKRNLCVVTFFTVGEIRHYISTQTFGNGQFVDACAVLRGDTLSSFVERGIQQKIQLLCCL